jgi:hypothetical protein
MTYQDPKLPDPGLGRNPPRYREPDGFGPGRFVAIVLGAVMVVGLVAYAMSGRSSMTAGTPPLTTTGQGGAQISRPAAPNIVPRAIPASPATDPGATTGEAARPEIAPSAPQEPRIDN